YNWKTAHGGEAMTTSTPVNIGTLIYSRPDLHSGKPCLAGTGMTVHAVAARYLSGMSAEEIQDTIPDLDLSLFYAAITYYLANRARIDAELAEEQGVAEELAARYQNGWRRENM
ncbi:MAG: DUF433 domain-containing protein, partial [Acidimicrobiales bacterium]